MKKSYYNKSNGQGKLGINLVRTFVDENQCYLHEIKQENDVGIDAFIEFTKNGENDGKCIAVQIKAGDSYFNKSKTCAKIPIDNHYYYWKNHSLPVFGFVCDLASNTAYWISITKYIKEYSAEIESGTIKTITFPVMEINTLNKTTFETAFKKIVYNQLPSLSYEQAMRLTHSKHVVERAIAIDVLANEYADRVVVWDRLFELLKEETDRSILCHLVHYLSYIPHHPDLSGILNFSTESKARGRELIKTIDKSLIVKMLSLIDDDNGIGRGTIGQCVESIINIVPHNQTTLIDIIEEHSKDDIGKYAFYILAYYNPKFVIKNEDKYIDKLGENASVIINYCKQYGGLNFYS